MYSDTVMDVRNPRNAGEIRSPGGAGAAGKPVFGDNREILSKIGNAVVVEAKSGTPGCGAAIASGSLAGGRVNGRTRGEGREVPARAGSRALDGLPRPEMHDPVPAGGGIHQAILDCCVKQGPGPRTASHPRSPGHEEADTCLHGQGQTPALMQAPG